LHNGRCPVSANQHHYWPAAGTAAAFSTTPRGAGTLQTCHQSANFRWLEAKIEFKREQLADLEPKLDHFMYPLRCNTDQLGNALTPASMTTA
jgi:hypothetical protein